MKKIMVVMLLLILGAISMPCHARETLPTYKALSDRFDGVHAGFITGVTEVLETVSNEEAWNACLEDNSLEVAEADNLLAELNTILEYYRITKGSDDALDNFNRWEKDFIAKWPKALQSVQKCYLNETQQLKEVEN